MSVAPKKLYVVMIDFTGKTIPEAIKGTFEMERDIAILAKKTGEEIHSHLETKALTVPVVLLECSEKFLEEVKRLPSFGAVKDFPLGAVAVRREGQPTDPSQQAKRPAAKPRGPKGPFGI